MVNKKLLAAIFGLSITTLVPSSMMATRLVGYYENWAIYNQQQLGVSAPYNTTPSNFAPIAGQIDVLNYAFATFNENLSNQYPSYTDIPTRDWQIYLSDPNDYSQKAYDGTNYTTPLLNQAFALKQQNPALKVVLSIGGWNFATGTTTAPNKPGMYGYYTTPFFSLMANDQDVNTGANPANPYQGGAGVGGDLNYRYGSFVLNSQGSRNKFVDSCVNYLTTNQQGGNYSATGFDGIDIDWEYPGRLDKGGAAGDYNGLLAVLKGIREGGSNTIDVAGKIISMATPSGASAPSSGAAGTPVIAPVAWAAGTFSDGTPYPSSTAAEVVTASNQLTFTSPDGRSYSFASQNEKLYFMWLTLCAHECDWFNVMTYDYYGSTFFPAYNTSGQPLNSELAPLFVDPASNPVNGSVSQPPCVDRTIGMYLNALVPATASGGPGSPASSTAAISMPLNKINMGIPAYGRGFNNPNPGAGQPGPVPGSLWQQVGGAYTPTSPGPISKQAGYYNYYEITDSSTGTGQHFTSVVLNGTSQTTYATSNPYGCFCSFDGAGTPNAGSNIPNTVALKAQYIQKAGLGGVMIWALDCDDTQNGFPVTTQAATCKLSIQTSIGAPGKVFGQQNGNNN